MQRRCSAAPGQSRAGACRRWRSPRRGRARPGRWPSFRPSGLPSGGGAGDQALVGPSKPSADSTPSITTRVSSTSAHQADEEVGHIGEGNLDLRAGKGCEVVGHRLPAAARTGCRIPGAAAPRPFAVGRRPGSGRGTGAASWKRTVDRGSSVLVAPPLSGSVVQLSCPTVWASTMKLSYAGLDLKRQLKIESGGCRAREIDVRVRRMYERSS